MKLFTKAQERALAKHWARAHHKNQKGNLMNDQVNTEVPQFDIPLELRRKAGEPVPFQTEADKGKDATVVQP